MQTETIGHVPAGVTNRYWQFMLDKEPSRPRKIAAYAFWSAHACAILAYSLLLRARVGARYSTSKTLRELSIAVTRSERAAIDEFIDTYPTSTYPLMAKSMELAYFRQQILPEPCLELGTGDGFFPNKLYEGNADHKVTIASDLIAHTLVQAKKYNFWRKLAIIDSMQIPLPDNSIATVLMNNLIHHLPDRVEILKEVHRILRPGGTFVVTDEYATWATSQWHVAARSPFLGIGKKIYNQHLDKFLERSVQCLLLDHEFWPNQGKTEDWDVVEVREFLSNEAMYVGSILESLNRKLGSPTPKPIRDILDAVPALGRLQTGLTRRIAEELIIRDRDMCAKYGATSVFVMLRKRDNPIEKVVTRDPELVCPVCKDKLYDHNGSRYCLTCRKGYPVVEGIPFLVPYSEELPSDVLHTTEGKVVPEVSC